MIQLRGLTDVRGIRPRSAAVRMMVADLAAPSPLFVRVGDLDDVQAVIQIFGVLAPLGGVQGQFALSTICASPGASSRADDTAAASSHADSASTLPQRPAAAAAAATIAATASAAGDPAGPGSSGSGSSAHASAVNPARSASAREANRRSQPRTVAAGRQQHMSPPATLTPGPPRTQPPADPALTADHTRPGTPPSPQPRPACRARQPPLRQQPLDAASILAYREHGASARLSGPPGGSAKRRPGGPVSSATRPRCRRT